MWFVNVIWSIASSTFYLSLFVTNFKFDLTVLKQSGALLVSVFLWGVQLWIKPL